MKKNRIGETNINRYGSKMEIIEYNGAFDVIVKFENHGYITKCQYTQFKAGRVKNPYDRSVLGIGYIGEGKYKPSNNSKITRIYETWHGMFERCNNEKALKRNPTYRGCTVADEWHNFQTFAKWYEENYYSIENELMHLDKDILIKGNKVYSPQNCVFVPESINLLFTNRNNHRGKHPIGVYWKEHNQKFCANGNNKNKREYLGLFDTPIEAFNAYKKHKENIIKIVANEYINRIPEKLYHALINYKVELND